MASSVVVISSAACEPPAGSVASSVFLVRMIELGVRSPGFRRSCGRCSAHRRGGMIVMRRRRIFAGKAIAGADKRDRAGNDGAEKRQEDDGFVHTANR